MSIFTRLLQLAESNNLIEDEKVIEFKAFIILKPNGEYVGIEGGKPSLCLAPPKRTGNILPYLLAESCEYILARGAEWKGNDAKTIARHEAFIAHVGEFVNVSAKAKALWAFLTNAEGKQKAAEEMQVFFEQNFPPKKFPFAGPKERVFGIAFLNEDGSLRFLHEDKDIQAVYKKEREGAAITCALTGLPDTKVALGNKEPVWGAEVISHNDISRCSKGLKTAADFNLGTRSARAYSRALNALKQEKCFIRTAEDEYLLYWCSSVTGNQSFSGYDPDLADLLGEDLLLESKAPETKPEEEEVEIDNVSLKSNYNSLFSGKEVKPLNRMVHLLHVKKEPYNIAMKSYQEIPHEEAIKNLKSFKEQLGFGIKLDSYKNDRFKIFGGPDPKLEIIQAVLLGKSLPRRLLKIFTDIVKMDIIAPGKFGVSQGQLAYLNLLTKENPMTAASMLGKFLAVCGQQQYRVVGTETYAQQFLDSFLKNPMRAYSDLSKRSIGFDFDKDGTYFGRLKNQIALELKITGIPNRRLIVEEQAEFLLSYNAARAKLMQKKEAAVGAGTSEASA